MTRRVIVTSAAESDILEIWRWLDEQVGRETADVWTERLMAAGETLRTFPARGAIVAELIAAGEAGIRQCPVGPYRLLYEVTGDTVSILAVVHTRRDLRAALEHRLLRHER